MARRTHSPSASTTTRNRDEVGVLHDLGVVRRPPTVECRKLVAVVLLPLLVMFGLAANACSSDGPDRKLGVVDDAAGGVRGGDAASGAGGEGGASGGNDASGNVQTYTTTFPLTERPISENGRWITGGTVGLDWTDVRTMPGLAFGSEVGIVDYTDSWAVLTGAWLPDQTVTATVRTDSQDSACNPTQKERDDRRPTRACRSRRGPNRSAVPRSSHLRSGKNVPEAPAPDPLRDQ